MGRFGLASAARAVLLSVHGMCSHTMVIHGGHACDYGCHSDQQVMCVLCVYDA